MDYGSLIREAWSITRRHRFLWVLGLFAASSVGTCNPTGTSSFQIPAGQPLGRPDDFEGFPAEGAQLLEGVARWAGANFALIGLLALLLFLVGLAFMVVSLITQGGMARATADLARGRPSSLGTAWRAGRHYFWRYLGLWLLLLLVTIAVAIVVAVVVGIFIGLTSLVGNGARVLLLVIGGLFAIVGGLAAIALGILASIVVAYAQRAIAVEDAGPLGALRSGIDLLRGNLGTSLLVWLVNVALGIGVGIALALVMVVALAILGAAGALIWALAGLSPPTIVYAAVAFLAFIAVLWGLAAIVNTYFWSYWTIAYLRLSGQMEPAPEP